MDKIKMVPFWIKRRTKSTFEYDTHFWRMTTIGIWLAASIAVIIAGIGNPTGFGILIDVGLHFMAHNFVFMISAIIIAFLFSLMYIPIPRLLMGSFLYTGGLVYYMLDAQSLNALFSAVIAFSYPIFGMVLGFIVAIYMNRKMNATKKVVLSLAPVTVLLVAGGILYLNGQSEVEPSFIDEDPFEPLQAENPANMQDRGFDYFTYGSGTDRHRDEYGEEVGIVSSTVDASEYITRWNDRKESFWGFDETELPLNGRVWMPEGEGDFPLVLMVHGNHRMENFSDDGYGYLGELLASRGFITISVDQNYLNYSGWSGIPNDDMKMRAWILMKHLLQIQEFSEEEGTPFFNKVNFDEVAVMGHSRGGQAAAMVADYTEWFEEDESLTGMENIHIESVVGIAPTDRRVDDTRARLEEVNYLLIHGARDGDVNTFQGDRQYLRSFYYEMTDRFKASVYIGEANHSQFNTDWGRMDMRLPGGVFLNRNQMMEEEKQREVAKVYISAFLETTLHGSDDYRDLFRDVRYGENWLPNTQYITRFEDGNYLTFTDFNQSQDEIFYMSGIEVEEEGFSHWEIDRAEDRRDVNKGVNGVEMGWEDEAQFTIQLDDDFLANAFAENLDSFMMSLASMDLENGEENTNSSQLPHIEVEMVSEDGETARVALDPFRPVYPPIETQYTKLPWFDTVMRDEKYQESTESVFQTYEFPIAEFEQDNLDFQSGNITEITIYVSNGPGKIMVDDFGFLMN